MSTAIATGVAVSTVVGSGNMGLGPALWFLIMVILMIPLVACMMHYPEKFHWGMVTYCIVGVILFIVLANTDFDAMVSKPVAEDPMFKFKLLLFSGVGVVILGLINLISGYFKERK